MTTNDARIKTLQSIFEQHAERTDPCDLHTVLSIVADTILDINLREFIDTRAYWDILHATQSNPARSHNAISRMTRADDAIARYGDEDMPH